ncbi:hypothetical protein CNMCM5793_008069 [Aspergillus hiratsukae]|uniref:Myb-like DNA-binding domain-containing protein n=1 Tax=Aspergillus hiratsukae TaxID=1194566 RepID=A0A8H6UU99_9EURO|nr:hypothetical protein CNMCM5793_008069 [Aspergillus hiratsukae]KAF7164474.1 hypothetical protein CNMCM6106_000991 [Aspergillus hiratsukae]
MAPTNPDETVQFLLSCIRYSNNGKVDFSEVAKECNIVTKGAAAKRYERLIKAYNDAANETKTTAGSEPDAVAAAATPDSTPKKPKTAKAGPPKKPKAKQAGEGSSSPAAKRKAAGEGSKAGTKKARVLKESVVESAERMVEQRLSPVKEEEGSDAEEEKGDATAGEGEALFDQFCNSEGDGRVAVKEETEEVA